MRILGIDPALTITGYGVIEAKGSALSLVEAGIIKTSSAQPITERLNAIYTGIKNLLIETNPDAAVLEKLYSHYRHPTTAFVLGQARGVICLACARKKVPLIEYGATRVKKAVIGAGLASKHQVQRMVSSVLGLKEIPRYNDLTDALALAIAHAAISRVKI